MKGIIFTYNMEDKEKSKESDKWVDYILKNMITNTYTPVSLKRIKKPSDPIKPRPKKKTISQILTEFIENQKTTNEEVRQFIVEQRQTNKRQEQFNEEVKQFIIEQKQFNHAQKQFNEEQKQFNKKQEAFNEIIINRLDNVENRLDTVIRLNNLKTK